MDGSILTQNILSLEFVPVKMLSSIWLASPLTHHQSLKVMSSQ